MRLLIPVLTAGVLMAPANSHAAGPDFRRCDARFDEHPEAEETAQCYEDLGEDASSRGQVIRRLEGLLERRPEHPWLWLHLGRLQDIAGTDSAVVETLYRRAAGGFARHGPARGEALARLNLQRMLTKQGREDEAGCELERAAEAARASGDPLVLAGTEITEAIQRYFSSDLRGAYALLQHAQGILARNSGHQGYWKVAKSCLHWLGNLSIDLGLFGEAREHFARLRDQAVREGASDFEASARYGLVRTSVEELADLPDDRRAAEARRMAEEALATARRAGNRGAAALSHWILAKLTGGRQSREHLDLCLEEAPTALETIPCLNALASHLATVDPRRAEEISAQALALSRRSAPLLTAAAKAARMRVTWETAPREQAISDALEALEGLEELRELQSGPMEQPSFFSTWSDEYAWVAGRLLEESERDPGRIAQAFLVQERQRARTLLDTLARVGAAPVSRRQMEEQRAALLESIKRVRDRAHAADLPASEREHAQSDLTQLERKREDIERLLAASASTPADTGQIRLAEIPDVQGSLAEDEALLSFLVAPWKDWTGGFGGGSWLLVVTRGAPPRVYRLMGREELREEVCHFARLVAPVQQPCGRRIRRNITREAQAAILYRQLLGDALADLPPGIRGLVVIPDDALYRLPFAALRESEEADPLGARFQISVVPSATLALRWRGSRAAMGEVPLLAVANPPEPSQAQRARLQRAGIPLPSLPDLPDAVPEARAAVGALGRKSVLRGEDEVSERSLKDMARGGGLHDFAVLHFAGHAIVDDRRFQSSGLWLSPGAPEEDGLLQIQEIVGLDLDGRIVVLAACRSASGAVLRGEGVMSLARAFFQAGAHAVVGSLWPLADEDGEAFFGRFYHHLARGRSVAAALQAAQRDRIADGARDDAWAGLVVLGNGDLVPLPGGRSLLERHGAILAFGAALLLLYLLLLAYARRRRQPS